MHITREWRKEKGVSSRTCAILGEIRTESSVFIGSVEMNLR